MGGRLDERFKEITEKKSPLVVYGLYEHGQVKVGLSVLTVGCIFFTFSLSTSFFVCFGCLGFPMEGK